MAKEAMTETAKRILDETEAAEYIGMSKYYLRAWRRRGFKNGTPAPAYIKLGRSVRYDVNDLDRWLEQNRRCVGATSNAA